MKRFAAILITCLTAATAFCGNYQYSTRFRLSKKNFADTIDIEWHGNQIYLKGMLNGKPCRINFDTGSSMGMIRRSIHAQSLRPIGTINSRDANGKVSPVSVVALPELQIGSLKIKNYPATIQPQTSTANNGITTAQDYDLLLGFDIINKGLIVKIDVRACKMIITDRKNIFTDGGTAIPYRLVRFVPNIKFNVYADCGDEAIFDTGSPFCYEISQNSLKKFIEWQPELAALVTENKPYRKTIGIHGSESISASTSLKLRDFTIFGHTFSNIYIPTTDGNSRIGARILNYGSVVIDGRKKEIRFAEY